jgi:hypothetical protein
MIPHPYVITDQPVRCQPMDPREQTVIPDHLEAVKLAVRAERLQDLERLYALGLLGIFDYWVVKWFTADPSLYTHLTNQAYARAARVLFEEGLL